MCIISPKNKPLEEESPEELSPEGEKVHEISRSQYII